MTKLTTNQIQLLALVKRSVKDGVTAKVSKQVWPAVQNVLPAELVMFEPSPDGGGTVTLTAEGQVLVKWLL